MLSLHVKSERGILMNGGSSHVGGWSRGGSALAIVKWELSVFSETARVAAPGLSYVVCVVCRDSGQVGRGVNSHGQLRLLGYVGLC